MIARTWRGATRAADAASYLRYLHETGLREYRSAPGNLGVLTLQRIRGGRAEFLLVSLWKDEAAIRRFAGDDLEQAVFYEEDERFLVEADRTVAHHQVVSRSLDRQTGPTRGRDIPSRFRQVLGRLLASTDAVYDPTAEVEDDRHTRAWRLAGFR